MPLAYGSLFSKVTADVENLYLQLVMVCSRLLRSSCDLVTFGTASSHGSETDMSVVLQRLQYVYTSPSIQGSPSFRHVPNLTVTVAILATTSTH